MNYNQVDMTNDPHSSGTEVDPHSSARHRSLEASVLYTVPSEFSNFNTLL